MGHRERVGSCGFTDRSILFFLLVETKIRWGDVAIAELSGVRRVSAEISGDLRSYGRRVWRKSKVEERKHIE